MNEVFSRADRATRLLVWFLFSIKILKSREGGRVFSCTGKENDAVPRMRNRIEASRERHGNHFLFLRAPITINVSLIVFGQYEYSNSGGGDGGGGRGTNS